MKYVPITILILLTSCIIAKIPKEQLSQYHLDNRYEFNSEGLEVLLNNTLQCPIRIWIQPKDVILKTYFDQINPITLKPLGDTILRTKINDVKIKEIGFASRFGDVNQKISTNKVGLPYPKSKKYRLVQGYNSNPTHNTDRSRYALDFGLSIGDTICSATQGYVVGVIKDYKYGGMDEKWEKYGNAITIYDQTTGLYTQYVHLKYKGSFVRVGDKIEKGQKIGIAGMTGQTNIEHLHFNCLKPIHSEHGLISIPMDSIGGYSISELKRNDLIRNEN